MIATDLSVRTDIPKKLRRTHYEQLLEYAKDAQRVGWHYGNEAQFRKRHDDIVAFLEAEISRLTKASD